MIILWIAWYYLWRTAIVWALIAWLTCVTAGNLHAWWPFLPAMSGQTALGVTLPLAVAVYATSVLYRITSARR